MKVGPRTTAPLLAALLLAGLAGGCASDVALAPATDHLAVLVLGDGFVRTGERRIPLELFVLELRQRVRAMSKEQVAGLRVQIDVDPAGGEAAVRGAERLLDQLQIMGVQQARFL